MLARSAQKRGARAGGLCARTRRGLGYKWWFNGGLMGFNYEKWWFNGDLTMKNGGLMGFNHDKWWFNGIEATKIW